MFKIVRKERLNPTTTLMDIEAPLVARRALPGQFIIFRVDEAGERIPLTIAGYDREKGTVTIIFQIVGLSTQRLNEKEEGEYIQDFVGPLGHPSECEIFGRVAVIGGGLGVAIAYPQAKALKEAGNEVDFIVGFRNKDLVILEDEFRSNCGNLFLLTDDGSYGEKGFVTAALQRQLDAGVKYDRIIAIGPLPMMKAVCDMTRPHGIKTIISMNTIMIDGTGMCGGCRLTVGGKTKFACVDGPDFDGHEVDFDSAAARGRLFRTEEQQALHEHNCRMKGMVENA
ncbi:MAG: sulfide/dihydroorotate dehydrogenase-like FAD/NAD-binding protein [Firmicutes bacterium]|nr:sulfide/dihydroorotate dehydrogenase-like FAD/NAD-binding protein [Bacillota bacterium]